MNQIRIGLVIADFESNYSTSFQHTARVKYGVDFNTSNVDSLGEKLNELKYKVENNIHNNVHVGFAITIEHVDIVEELLQEILNRYASLFGSLPINRKIYTINQKLREAETPTTKEIAKEVIGEILNPKTEKLTKTEKLKIDAKVKSKERAMKLLQKNSRNKK
ncbi:MAG: hypothetical protein EBU01_02355 [Crocinitomicaceae bacterium]|nr:hypothetical protein [Crocinitomicaceae bacterium]NCA20902.1 hypothetical protein [Crocinitomicaceae bacterium]